MTKEKIFEGLKEAQNYILFIFILILFLLPFLKEFYPTSIIFQELDYPIIIISGIIGVYFLLINLIIKYYKSDNKNQILKDTIPILMLFLYMIWTLISCIYSDNKDLAFLGTFYRKEGYLTYIAYSGIFGLAFCITSKKLKKILLYSFSIISIITIILVQIANYWNIPFLVYNKDITTTSFSNSNHYGYYLLLVTSISSFLFISDKNKIYKIFNLLIYSCLLYFLILNNTFGCYLALILTFVISIATVVIKKEKKLYITISIIIFVLISILPTSKINGNITQKNIKTLAKDVHYISSLNSSDIKWQHAGSGRMKLWKYGVQFFLEKPIIGYGPENLGKAYKKVGVNLDRPHNLLIQLATTSGLPGLILYCSAIRNYTIEKLKKSKYAKSNLYSLYVFCNCIFNFCNVR